MGKTIFFLFNWSLFQSRSYNCTSIGSCWIKKNEPLHGGGTRANGYAARQNRRGIWLYNQLLCHRKSDFFSSATKTLLHWRRDPPLATKTLLHWRQDPPLKHLSSWIGTLATRRLDKWLRRYTLWLCFRSSKPRCSPVRKPVLMQLHSGTWGARQAWLYAPPKPPHSGIRPLW